MLLRITTSGTPSVGSRPVRDPRARHLQRLVPMILVPLGIRVLGLPLEVFNCKARLHFGFSQSHGTRGALINLAAGQPAEKRIQYDWPLFIWL